MYSAIFSRFYRQSNSILITDEPYPFPTKCYDRIARLTKDMAQMERLFINPKINMRQYTLRNIGQNLRFTDLDLLPLTRILHRRR